MDPYALALVNQRIADQLAQPPAPQPVQSPLAALAARTGKGPKGDVDITMVGDGKRPRPKNSEVVWNATYTKWRHKDGTTWYDK